jgi:hypothetical protein
MFDRTGAKRRECRRIGRGERLGTSELAPMPTNMHLFTATAIVAAVLVLLALALWG